uniref:Peptidase C19 ubiquitin carboxyl-terminal hydrolase domain-containing protein n=1 Tax=viral metagenome TaxID=1070528 RepID=A0A6C0LY26_9ZZZZ
MCDRRVVIEFIAEHMDGVTDETITSTHLSGVFRSYDDICFGKEMTREAKLKNIRIGIRLDNRSDGETVEYDRSAGVVRLIYSRRSLAHHHARSLSYRVMVCTEQLIIQLCMVLFGYLRVGDEMMGMYGRLYDCASKSVFGHGKILTTAFENEANSCYMDSMLAILMLVDNSAFRDAIFYSNIRAIDYSREVCIGRLGGQNRRVKITELATNIRRTLRLEYDALLHNNPVCTNIRRYTVECLESTRRGEMDEPYPTYSFLTDLFQDMKMTLPTYRYVRVGDGYAPRPTDPVVVGAIGVDEYMSSPHSGGGEHTHGIDWALFDDDLLVMYSLGQYLILDELGKEGDLNKERALAEYILNDRYRLMGVTIHIGGDPKRNADRGHYTAYIRIWDTWYYYDDLSNYTHLTDLDALPVERAFRAGGGRRPTMFFYERV